MRNKRINCYEFPDRQPDLAKLKNAFKRNVPRFSGPYFEADTEVERRFLEYCRRLNVAVHRKTIVEYRGEDNAKQSHLYLSLRSDNGTVIPYPGLESIAPSSGCPGDRGYGICQSGAIQTEELAVAEKAINKINAFGFLMTLNPFVPKMYLASPSVAEALRGAGATGCEIMPCRVRSNANGPPSQVECYQLKITASTLGPVQIGNVRFGLRCPICRTVKSFLSDHERYFRDGDLNGTDFQVCLNYNSDNAGPFKIVNGFPIVSRRIMDLLLKLKVKGLARYTTDPPIKCAVVQIE